LRDQRSLEKTSDHQRSDHYAITPTLWLST